MGQERLVNGRFAAPELVHSGQKNRDDTNQNYIYPQELCDILFKKLGAKSGALRVMLVLCGTKPGFYITEAWMLERTGLLRQNYLRARKELENMGWITCKMHNTITVNFDKIYEDGAAESDDNNISDPTLSQLSIAQNFKNVKLDGAAYDARDGP